MRKKLTHKLLKFVLVIIFVLTYQALSTTVYSQTGGIADGETLTTNPKTRTSTVTATVPDIIAPTTPILISPTDESLINDATPDFIWQESTDNVGVSYYELYLDGALLYGSLPTVTTTTSEYTLNYDSSSGRYTLTPVALIADGTHTWQVKVYDAAGNSNSSAIWDFTVDTQAPSFIITQIDTLTTNISATDISSVPTNPIELENNEPKFIGTTQANATIEVTVQVPDESNQVITLTADSNGDWSFQLGILPREKVITLNFIITDLAGNISILTDLKIIIKQQYFIIPPTPTPTPSPTPTASASATPTPAPTLSPPTPAPIIKIPIIPPKEIIENIKKKVIKVTPKPITQTVTVVPQDIRRSIQQVTNNVAPVGVFVATAAIPAISFFTLLFQLGQQFSWNIIIKILQAIGLIPPKEPQGMVFDSQTNEPVAFALLTITSTTDIVSERLIETVVTDVNGIYQGIQLPLGKYIINVSHQDFTFPTQKDRPGYLSIQEFYKGEEFEVTSTRRPQLFLIPVDRKIKIKAKNHFGKTLANLVRKIRLAHLFWPLFILSIIITIFYPTSLNLIMLSLYFLMLIKKLVKSLKQPSISGFVKTINQEPIPNATIRISNPEKGEMVAIINTNKHGYYEVFLKPNKYQIQISKPGLVWQRKGSLSFEEVDTTQQHQVVDATMQDITSIYKELFGELN